MSYLQFFQQFIGKSFPEGASGFTRWLNGTLLSLDENQLTMSFVVREDMMNPVGLLHGGVHSAIIDELSGFLVAVQPVDTWFVSVNLSVDFHNKVKLGEEIIGKAVIKKRGKTIINVECELVNSDGEIVSRGTTNLANTFKPKSIL